MCAVFNGWKGQSGLDGIRKQKRGVVKELKMEWILVR